MGRITFFSKAKKQRWKYEDKVSKITNCRSKSKSKSNFKEKVRSNKKQLHDMTTKPTSGELKQMTNFLSETEYSSFEKKNSDPGQFGTQDL